MSTFRHDGIWWDPHDPSREWIGTLRFNERDGAILAVTAPPERAELFPPLREYDSIHGVTTAGRAVTLLRCFDRKAKGSLPGVPRSKEVFANAVILGFHCDQSDPLVSSASVSLLHMKEWWGRSGIKPDSSLRWPNASVQYAAERSVVVYEDASLRVSICPVVSGRFGSHQVSLIEDVRFEARASTPMPLSHFQRILDACGDILSIACLTYCSTLELSLVAPGSGGTTSHGTYHAIPLYGGRKHRSPFMLFRFQDIEHRASKVFSAWLSSREMLTYVRALYFAGVYGGGFIEGKLLALTQAVEAFHRRFCPGLYMDETVFAMDVLSPLKAAIPACITKDLRESIAARLRFANEYSQRKRLRVLFAEHSQVLRVLVDDPEAYVSPIVDHRNEFTHFPLDALDIQDPSPALRPERVLLYNALLRLLLESCFLKVMGFSMEEAMALVERSEMYRQLAGRLRRVGVASR